jgi:hypothetical protein
MLSLSSLNKGALMQEVLKLKRLPKLSENDRQNCLEFYLDDIEIPNYVVFGDELIQAIKPDTLTKSLVIQGDEGAIFVQVDGNILGDRRDGWQIPQLSFKRIEDQCDELEAVFQQLKNR